MKWPDLVPCVVVATHLRCNLRLAFAVRQKGLRCVVSLNTADRAEQQGLGIDADRLAAEVGVPVVRTIAVVLRPG